MAKDKQIEQQRLQQLEQDRLRQQAEEQQRLEKQRIEHQKLEQQLAKALRKSIENRTQTFQKPLQKNEQKPSPKLKTRCKAM